MKGKNPERWLTYVLDHVKGTKDADMYKLLPEFLEDINRINKHLFIDTSEYLADSIIHHQG